MTFTRASIKTAYETYRDNPTYHGLTAALAAEYLGVCESTIVVWRRKIGLSKKREPRLDWDARPSLSDGEIFVGQHLNKWTRPTGIDAHLEAINEVN